MKFHPSEYCKKTRDSFLLFSSSNNFSFCLPPSKAFPPTSPPPHLLARIHTSTYKATDIESHCTFSETGFTIYNSSFKNSMAPIDDSEVIARKTALIRRTKSHRLSQPPNVPARKQVLNEPVQNKTTTCLRQNQLPNVLGGKRVSTTCGTEFLT